MSEFAEGRWTGPEAVVPADELRERLEDQLTLRDRITVLEAKLAEASGVGPSAQLSAEGRIVDMQGSAAWRLGNAITHPRRAIRRILRRR